MDDDVYRFGQNAREGQSCPIGPTVRTGRAHIFLPQSLPLKQDGSYRTIREGNHNWGGFHTALEWGHLMTIGPNAGAQ